MAAAVGIALGLMMMGLGLYQQASPRHDVNILGGVWIVLGVILAVCVIIQL